MKNFKTKLFAAAMAAPLAMSGMSVFATEGEETPTEPVAGELKITKKFNTPTGATVLDKEFSFTAKLNSVNGDASYAKDAVKVYSVNANQMNKVSDEDGVTTYTATSSNIIDNKLSHPTAGVYNYTIVETGKGTTENIDGKKGEITYSAASYTVNVYVVNTEDGVKVSAVSKSDGAAKSENLEFVNTYTRATSADPGDEDFDGLVINNIVDGQLGDKQKDFSYTVRFSDQNTSVKKSDGAGAFTTVTPGTDGKYTLKHGESLYVTGAAVGSTYEVTQDAATGYTTKVKNTTADNGGLMDNIANGMKGTITQAKDSITFTNTTDDTTIPTGNIINNMPFLGLIAVALGGFIAYIALKRRQNA